MENKILKDKTNKTPPRYPKPNILLIDLSDDLYSKLQLSGFNVLKGTFGLLYKVPRGKGYMPIIIDYDLPKVKEQEIVIIDLDHQNASNSPKHSYSINKGDQWYWSNFNTGIIDPRPITMKKHQKDFDRILNHGGFFVIFAESRKNPDIIKGGENVLGELKGTKYESDNWSFLTRLSNIAIHHDDGEEIKISKCKHEICSFLERNIENVHYNATFEPTLYNLKENWHPILCNKYGQTIGTLITPNDLFKGYILILPQIYNKNEFIIKLINEILPLFSPELFPYIKKGKWIEREEYELNSVTEHKSKIFKIKKESELKINEIEIRISEEKEKWGFLQGILTNSGDELVEDVKKCLKLIGFTDIRDVDKEIEGKGGDEKQEDLQIHDESPTILLEIKGVSGPLKEEYTMQAVKYIHRRMKEWDRTDIRGVCIINHYRNIPPLDRDNENVFTKQQIEDAKIHDISLLTTWDLFILIRGMLEHGWNSESIRSLFYKNGRIHKIPTNYQPIGKIVNYWETPKVVGIEISENSLSKGQKIGYLLKDGYLEEEVLSVQVDSNDVENALPGQLAGIKTIYPKKILKNGIKVFSIK